MTWFLRQLDKAVAETRDWPDWAKREAGLTLHLPNEAALAKLRAGKPPGRNKYGAVKTVREGITFDSGREAERYGELVQLEADGAIKDLETKTPACVFRFVINGVKVGRFTADFRYTEDGQAIVEDSKSGVASRDYVLRKKLMLACFGIAVRETR